MIARDDPRMTPALPDRGPVAHAVAGHAGDATASASTTPLARKRRKRRRLLVAGALAVAATVAVVAMPERAIVDLGVVDHGPITSTLDEEGRSRMERRVVVSAPSAGNLLPAELEPGDVVAAGDTVALLEPVPAPLIDTDAQAELVAGVDAAAAAIHQARANAQRVEEQLASARRHLARQEHLAAGGAVARVAVDDARTDVQTLQRELESARFGASVAAEQHAAQRAVLRRALGGGTDAPLPLEAARGGVVLAVHREHGGIVEAGAPLVEIGDPSSMEVVVPVLTEDALELARGRRVILELRRGDEDEDVALEGHVRTIEPMATTKLSPLGVEEQRVNVIVALDEPAPAILGDGFAVQSRIVRWEGDVVRVPAGALFRKGEGWAVWVDDEGRAVQRDVVIGHRAGPFAEVRAGLTPGERVVLYPGDALRAGTRLAARAEAPR